MKTLLRIPGGLTGAGMIGPAVTGRQICLSEGICQNHEGRLLRVIDEILPRRKEFREE